MQEDKILMYKYGVPLNKGEIATMQFVYVTQYYQGFLGLPGTKLPVGAVHQG